MDEGFLKRRQKAHAAGGGGDKLELVGGVDDGALGHGDVKPVQNGGGRGLEKPDCGTRNRHEHQHGRSHGDGQPFSTAERERLGHQFADDNVEVGDEGKAQRDGENAGVEMCVGQSGKQRRKNGRGQRFAQPAKGQRAEGYAKLDGGQQLLKPGLEQTDGARAGSVRGDHLLDAGFANGDQRELRGDKKRVGQDEHGHGDRFEQLKALHLGERIALHGLRNAI